MPEVVLMKQTESVTVITLNRPEKRNAVNYPMIDRVILTGET